MQERRSQNRRSTDNDGELSSWAKARDMAFVGLMGLMALAMISMMRGMSDLNVKLGKAITASEGHAALEQAHYNEFLRTRDEMEQHYREDRERFIKMERRR